MPDEVRRNGEGNRFTTTQWSLVVAAGDSRNPGSREALGRLCQIYWYPVYAHARHLGEGPDGFEGALDSNDHFGSSLASLGDLDGDGFAELAVGAPGDDDGAIGSGQFVGPGAVWILFLNGATGGDHESSGGDDGYEDPVEDLPRTVRPLDGLHDVMADHPGALRSGKPRRASRQATIR